MRRTISGMIYALSTAIGILAFAYPFFTDISQHPYLQTHNHNAPLFTAALVGLAVTALLVEVQGRQINAKTVALLGILVAIASVLRFLETAMPMPGGFSPVFVPIILAGYVFGGRFGFLMGAFTLLASALVTGGIGPWLPYQMFTAGWAGMTAGWLGRVVKIKNHHWETALLCVFGFGWGLLYGMIINVYFWPFAAGPVVQSWAPGLTLWASLRRYAAFYVVTSLAWDLARAVGNVALILLLGPATVQALARFRKRFYFEVQTSDA